MDFTRVLEAVLRTEGCQWESQLHAEQTLSFETTRAEDGHTVWSRSPAHTTSLLRDPTAVYSPAA